MKKRATSVVKKKVRPGDDAPLTARELASMRPVALSKTVRWKLGLSQAQFARQFGLSPGTVRDWEQYRSKPDAAARSYLETIAADPDAVRKARKKIKPTKVHEGAHPR